MKKKILLSVVLSCLISTINCWAVGGITGDLTWELNESTGVLTISGKGEMPNNNYSSPWSSYSSSIKEVIIKEGVTNIGSYAFNGCIGLTSITLPDGLTNIGNRAFESCSGLTSIILPVNVIAIEDEAFLECTGLTSITLSDGLIDIGYRAFYGCSSLTSITIPASVTHIDEGIFFYCSSLTSILVDVNNSVYSSENGCLFNKDKTRLLVCPMGVTSVTLPASVTCIGDHAFSDCAGLTSITLPTGVTSIEDHAFSGCIGLTSMILPVGVTRIENSVFEYCTGLTSITLPDSLTDIEEYAFERCISLISITIPASVTAIDDGAFYDCSGLTSILVDVNNNVYSSENGCLFNKDKTRLLVCPRGLTSVSLPESVICIGDAAFQHCTGLTSITLPGNVTDICDDAFWGCTGLTSIHSHNVTPPAAGYYSTFEEVDTETCILYVPIGSKQLYGLASGWREFRTIIEEDISSISTETVKNVCLYFNLTGESFKVRGLTQEAKITVYTITGEQIISKTIAPEEEISVSNLSAGVYLVRVNGETMKLGIR